MHQSFIDKIDNINLDETEDGQQEQLEELIDFLANWLIYHIMKMDRQIPVKE